MNGMNQQRYRFNVDKYSSNSKQVFTVQQPRVQLKLQPQPQQALAPVVVAHTPVAAPVVVAVAAAVPKPVVVAVAKPKPVHVPVQSLVSLKPGHTKAQAQAQAPAARSSNLVKLK